MVIFGLFLHGRILKRLEEKHFGTWDELGKPSLFLNNSIGNGLNVLTFLFKRKYLKLNDEILAKMCNFEVAFDVFYLLYFISFILLNIFVLKLK